MFRYTSRSKCTRALLTRASLRRAAPKRPVLTRASLTRPVLTRAALTLTLLSSVALTACKGGVGNIGTDISTSQAVLDLGQSIADVREENSILQAQIDSLHGAMAYQDSVLRQLTSLAGVTMRPPAASIP